MTDIQNDRKLPGPGAPLTAERDLYLRLMAQGMSNSQACRVVGINRRTGTRWRYGRTISNKAGLPWIYLPIATKPVVISPRFLSETERITLADLRRTDRSIRSIAAEMGRSPSTISKELRRNANSAGRYEPHGAHQQATSRRSRSRTGKLARDPVLQEYVQDCLKKRWSPEQICHTLPTEFPDDPQRRLVHETIYQALYVQGRGGLRRELAVLLRTGRARRKPHRRADARRPGGFADSMVMISERPAEAEDRALPGHWEGDLITGESNRTAIGTLVERSTRFVILLHLPNGHGAVAVRDALVSSIATLPLQLRRSLTWDQGTEMARHREFTVATDIPVFFCDPHSPWQRGSNENTNGLLRQYFPKSTDLSIHSREHLDEVAAELNARPRKTLQWRTPAEELATLISLAD
ncbi:MAG: IS30 family transposase [Nakamurella sp.]